MQSRLHTAVNWFLWCVLAIVAYCLCCIIGSIITKMVMIPILLLYYPMKDIPLNWLSGWTAFLRSWWFGLWMGTVVFVAKPNNTKQRWITYTVLCVISITLSLTVYRQPLDMYYVTRQMPFFLVDDALFVVLMATLGQRFSWNLISPLKEVLDARIA